MLPHQGLLINGVRRSKFQHCRRGRRRPRNCPVPRGLSRRGPSLYCARRVRRGGRVAEGARLESVYTGNRIVGSNPTLSASAIRNPFSGALQTLRNRTVWLTARRTSGVHHGAARAETFSTGHFSPELCTL